jgi:DNA polymerase (family 10)
MSTNQDVADRLGEIALLLELLGADKFRVLANQKAARVIEALPADVGAIAAGPEAKGRLMDFDGVGPKIADKVIEFVATGRIGELDELRAQVPAGLGALLMVQGLGPKTVRALWQTLGVTDLAGLERVIADGSILTLPRMGEKAVEKLKAALAVRAEGDGTGGRLALGRAMPLAERIVAGLLASGLAQRAQFAGSLRRGKETVGDIDVLAVASDPARAARAFCAMGGVAQVLAHGERRCSVRVRLDGGQMNAEHAGEATTRAKADDGSGSGPVEEGDAATRASAGAGGPTGAPTVQVDLRLVPEQSWGAALMYFTGSKEHNVRLRERALRQGLTLNEYGLFPEDPRDERPPQERGVKAVAGASEDEVYAKLGLAWVPPELREDRGECDGRALPALLRVEDVRAELHSHTTASDGLLSIDELASRAVARGFHTLAITDHSQSSAIANGLKPDRLRKHIKAIHEARARFKGLNLLAGSEVDILSDGRLDYDDALLKELDLVVASPHAALTQDGPTATKRLLRAIEHPSVRILGHPTGRLIGRRPGLDPDMGAIFEAARRCDVALEINAHWLRLDLRDTHVRGALEAGCLIAINCDVHHPEDFDHLRFGVLTGRRGGLTPERCINCWPSDRLAAWIRRGG